MSFTLQYLGKTETFDKKVRLLDLLGEKANDKEYVCARVNNRSR